jgi:hypothetical protein
VAGPECIYFDLHSTRPSNVAAKIEVNDPLLKRIRVGQPAAGTTRIVLETNVHPDFSVSVEQNPYRLVIKQQRFDARSGAR